MKRAFLVLAVLGISCFAVAKDIEEWVEDAPNPEELQAWLDDLRENPLDLNQATQSQVASLPFFDAVASESLIGERQRRGAFASEAEVLRLSLLSGEQREAIREFTCVKIAEPATRTVAWVSSGSSGVLKQTAGNSWGKARAEFATAGRQAGYVSVRRQPYDPSVITQSAIGVEFEFSPLVPKVTAGNFQYEAGTGLVFASSYGIGNWVSSPSAWRPGHSGGLVLRPSSSALQLYRGAAVEGKLAPFDVVVIGSWNRLDGALSDSGTSRITEGQTTSPSLDHARQDRIEERLAGACVHVGQDGWRIGVAGYESHFSPRIIPNESSGSLPVNSESLHKAGSVFFSVNRAGISAIGEAAESRPGAGAYQAAIAAGDAHFGLGIYQIYAAPNFYSPHSQLWGSYGSAANNRSVTGVKFRSAFTGNRLLFSAHTDQTPFGTATSSLSKGSSEIQVEWTTSSLSPLDIEVLGRRAWNDQTSLTEPAAVSRSDRARIELRWRTDQEFRVRFEVRSVHQDGQSDHGLGTLLFFQTKARVYATDVSAQLTFYGMNGNQKSVPLQVYEGGLTGMFPLLSLTGEGRRIAVVVSHTWSGLTLSAQAAQVAHRISERDEGAAEFAVGLSYRH